jgi:SAM-dependent methyltransferase
MERMHSEHFTTLPISAMEHRHRYAFAKSYSRGTVLDIACGIGYGSEFLCGPGGADRYYGVDYNAAAIREAVSAYESDRRSFSVGDILSLPFANGTFDAVFSFETLEHIKDAAAALKELKRVLSHSGVFVGSVPDGTFDAAISAVAGDNQYHYHRFSREQLGSLLRSEFANVQIGYAEVVIASHIGLVDGAPHERIGSTELTNRMKWTHGSFYFVCSDAALPEFAEDIAGYLPFFEEQIRWIDAGRHDHRYIANLKSKLASAMRASMFGLIPARKERSLWQRLLWKTD